MSNYTTQVRYICENYAGYNESQPYTDINDIVDTAAPIIFENFPIFDEHYRAALERKILRHYYTREICAETVGLWKLWLNNKMNEIMPFYNKLYESELIKFNPMYDTDMHTIKSGNENTTSTENNDIQKKDYKIESENLNRDNKENNKDSKYTIGSKNSQYNDDETSENKEYDINSENSTKNDANSGSKSATSKEYNIGSENENSESNKDSTNRNAFSDTPQGNLVGVENGNYLSDYRKITDVGNEHNESNRNTVTNGNKTNTENDNASATSNENKNQIKNNNTNTKGNKNADETENEIYNENNKSEREGEMNENRNRIGNNNSNETANKANSIGTTEQYIEHVSGKRGSVSYSKMLSEFRKTFLNIDAMVINELADLFMTIY